MQQGWPERASRCRKNKPGRSCAAQAAISVPVRGLTRLCQQTGCRYEQHQLVFGGDGRCVVRSNLS